MAKRLATVYVKACLRLTEADMADLMKMFQEQHLSNKVKVFENGNQEFVFFEEEGAPQVTLTFERQAGGYVLEGSYSFNTPKMANIMRKAVSAFKGEAIVNRIYPDFTMIYHYERGSVVKIVEQGEDHQKVIYEYRNTLGRLQDLFLNKTVEEEIRGIHASINRLLDCRNQCDEDQTVAIDRQLSQHVRRLFVLEA